MADEESGQQHGGVHAELADDHRGDHLEELQKSQLNALGDAYKMHGQLIQAQREHQEALAELAQSMQASAEQMQQTAQEFQAFSQQEHENIEGRRAPIDTTPPKGKSFGGPGY